jgi:hypothetical protein
MRFEIEGREYELKYNLKRVKMIEAAIGESLLGVMVKTNGCLSLQQLETCASMALREVEGNSFVAQGKGREFVEVIENEGYTKVLEIVLEAIQRDCPFFFQNA